MSKKYPLPNRRIDIHNHFFDRMFTGDAMVAHMDKNGVEAAVMLACDYPGCAGNKHTLAQCKPHPGRLVPGAYLDPRDGRKAVDDVARFYDKGVRIIKLLPNYGYFPDDPKCEKFFTAIDKRGMCVLSHCGWLAPHPGMVTAAYYSHPGRFEKVIRRCINTTFVMAHMGGIAGYLETIMLLTRTPNTYADCSPGQGMLVLERGGAMVGAIPPTKLLFGADGDGHKGLIPWYAKALTKLGYGPHLEKHFYSNARGILEKIGALKT